MGRGPMKEPTKQDLRLQVDNAEYWREQAELEAAKARAQVEVLQETIVKAVEAKDISSARRHLKAVD